jgi:hypothetical protein
MKREEQDQGRGGGGGENSGFDNEYYIYCSVDGEEIDMMDLQVPRQCQSVRYCYVGKALECEDGRVIGSGVLCVCIKGKTLIM